MKLGPTTFQWMCFRVSARSASDTSRRCSSSATLAPSFWDSVGTVNDAVRLEVTGLGSPAPPFLADLAPTAVELITPPVVTPVQAIGGPTVQKLGTQSR